MKKRETLGQKQRRFAYQISKLIIWIYEELGYEVSKGDAFRDTRVHGRMGIKKGYGRRNSCHKLKLAQDLNLFIWSAKNKRRVYCRSTEAHRVIGEKWESMGTDHRWGGHYNDGNHYSFLHGTYQ